MYRLNSFRSHSTMIITFILALGYINKIYSESISSQTWSNLIQDISLKIHDEKIMESHPLNEGFILLTDNHKKPSTTKTSKPARLSVNNRISISHNISSTTCKTIIMIATVNQTSSPIVNHSVGHLSRRLLDERSYDTDINTTSKQTPIEDENEINNFLKVDDDELSKQLINLESTMDGSGYTTEETTEQTSEIITTSRQPTTSSLTPLTTTTTTVNEYPLLSNNTKFILTMNCTNANTTLAEILAELKTTFPYEYNVTHNEIQCNDSEKVNITLEFITDNKTDILNSLFEDLANIAKSEGVEIFSDNECGDNGIVPVTNVTSCFLIDLCHLCGTNTRRGVCLPENKESKCECFVSKNSSIGPYAGDFCWPKNLEPTKSVSIPARWTPIIVGILAGLTGLFFAITCCLWAVVLWRRRINNPKNDLRIRRLWNLPRAEVPASVTSENVPNDLNNTISTLSSNQTDSDNNGSDTTDSTFFKELDQRMGENLRATVTRPNTQAMLASLPSDTISTLSSYDPIDELDAIIDNEDLNSIFHDPLDELFEDNEMLEVVNPNLKLPRPNVDSKPTGLFSFFYKNS